MAFCITRWGGARRQGRPGSVKRLITEDGAVPHETRGRGSFRSSSASSVKRDGPIRGQPGEAAVFGGEEGVVDLTAAGVHGADDQPVQWATFRAMASRVETAAAGLVRGKGQSLGGGDADADAGEGAGADRHGDGVAVRTVRSVFFSMASTMGIRVRLWVRPVS